MKRKLLIFCLGIWIFCFLLFPQTVTDGAKEGLYLWFYTVMPSLLPFMILSTFMIRQGLTEPVSKVSGPILSKLFGIPRRCCYPVFIGFFAGFPMGAKVTGQMYLQGDISKAEAQYLLSFCNNASPMFLISFIGVECLHFDVPVELFLFIFLSAWFASLLTRKKYQISAQEREYEQRKRGKKENIRERKGIIASLDESIMDGFSAMAKIGGYLLLFSIIIRMILDMCPIEHPLKYISIGMLEVTTGGMLFSKISLESWLKYSIFVGLCAFGGVSSICQTASVIRETRLSLWDYVFSKCLQFVFAFLMSALWFLVTFAVTV